MKNWFVALILLSNTCTAQNWMGEVLVGVSAYNGDLTQSLVNIRNWRPAGNFNLKYKSGDLLNLRLGFGWGTVTANDKDNKNDGLSGRNLNFKSNIMEISLVLEANLFDPEDFYAYPYVFMGVGVFHFDPYSYDKNNTKVYLHPLSTEGQGIADFPDRKEYSLTKFCIPFGFGLKRVINKRWEISYELGSRFCFTDYLDDVSKRYVDLEILGLRKGALSPEMSYRRNIPFNELGEKRGNSSVHDFYFFSGIKIGFALGKIKEPAKSKSKPAEPEQ